ncbi:hypothetical protein [Pseudofrankia sp. BMG5.37]|uniref:hypothetical protein n=1 Tax=Pseudofrankia sp. BMG5.37 TaxID=3050035 RepID=UPI002894CF80|nr:hypothetical protein [Pseudofrankia sp. BMG5.37]MDT3439011.1 hypothetical protein [Pseudofrankia sp. BMG5.37]
MSSDASLISMPEIAELAGVRRPVVTTWRRRFPDFPAPVRAPLARTGSPLFEADAVVDWLVATGHGARRVDAAELRLYQLRTLAERMPARLLVGTATALICLRHLDDDESLVDGRQADSDSDGDDEGRALVAGLLARARRVDPDDRLLLAEVEALRPADAGWLVPAVDELVEAAYNTADAFERLLAVRHRFDIPELYAEAVVGELAWLAVKLSGVVERLVEIEEATQSGTLETGAARPGAVRVADPAAGGGDLLRAVVAAVQHDAEEIGDEGELRLSGVEPSRFLARLARRRLVVAGLAARFVDIRASAGRRLAGTGQGAGKPAGSRPASGADVVVTCLPFQPAESRDGADVLVAVRGIAEGLGPGQTAVVVGPSEVLVDALPANRSATRRRDELLGTGLVEAVVALPGGMVPFRPGYRTSLWVLRRDDAAPARGRVLLADLSDRELTAQVVESLAVDVTTWRRDGYRPELHGRTFASQALIADLVSAPGRPPMALTAPRPAGEPTRRAAHAVARVRELEHQLARPADANGIGDAAADIGVEDVGSTPVSTASSPLIAERDEPRPVPIVSLGRLSRTTGPDGPVLRIFPGARIAAADVVVGRAGSGRGDPVAHPVVGSSELIGGARLGERRIGLYVLADGYPRAGLTEPGDVIVTLTPRFGALVDEAGSSVVEFPARVLRLTPAGLETITPHVLAALLTAAAPAARTPGAVRGPRKLADLQIAMLPAAVSGRLDTLLAAANARRAAALRELDLLDELGRITVGGLADGTLTLIPPIPAQPASPPAGRKRSEARAHPRS